MGHGFRTVLRLVATAAAAAAVVRAAESARRFLDDSALEPSGTRTLTPPTVLRPVIPSPRPAIAPLATAHTFGPALSVVPSRGIDVVLRSHAQVEVDVTVTKRKADIEVVVTHRATGAPATGEVELSTKDDKATVALVDGRAAYTRGATGRKLRVDYLGDHQTRPASVKVRLR